MAEKEPKQPDATPGRTTQEGDEPGSAGRGWHGDSQGHAEAGRKGGKAVSQNRDHMAKIGSKGGKTVSQNRDHMVQIGRKGGKARGANQAAGRDASGETPPEKS